MDLQLLLVVSDEQVYRSSEVVNTNIARRISIQGSNCLRWLWIDQVYIKFFVRDKSMKFLAVECWQSPPEIERCAVDRSRTSGLRWVLSQPSLLWMGLVWIWSDMVFQSRGNISLSCTSSSWSGRIGSLPNAWVTLMKWILGSHTGVKSRTWSWEEELKNNIIYVSCGWLSRQIERSSNAL